jgi:hypothetical protein
VQGLDGGRRFDERYGTGWRLVLSDADAAVVDAGERSWFESIGGRVVSLGDPDPQFVRWFGEHGVAVALQRPDFYLYGTAPAAEDATALLASLHRHVAKGSTT